MKDRLSEKEAYDLEQELIAQHGKLSDQTGTLVNITDSGGLYLFEVAFVSCAGIEIPGLKKYYEARSSACSSHFSYWLPH